MKENIDTFGLYWLLKIYRHTNERYRSRRLRTIAKEGGSPKFRTVQNVTSHLGVVKLSSGLDTVADAGHNQGIQLFSASNSADKLTDDTGCDCTFSELRSGQNSSENRFQSLKTTTAAAAGARTQSAQPKTERTQARLIRNTRCKLNPSVTDGGCRSCTGRSNGSAPYG